MSTFLFAMTCRCNLRRSCILNMAARMVADRHFSPTRANTYSVPPHDPEKMDHETAKAKRQFSKFESNDRPGDSSLHSPGPKVHTHDW